MDEPLQLVVFRVDEQRYALPLTAALRVVRAVAVTPLPGAPATVRGVVDVEGRLVPVLDFRKRLGLPEREIGVDDQFLIATTAGRAIALAIDEVQDVTTAEPSAVTAPEAIAPGLDTLHGIAQLERGLVLIHDLERFLSLHELHTLDRALERAQPS